MSTSKRTVIYVRTATDGLDAEANLDRQIRTCQDYAKKLGDLEIEVVQDVASYAGRQALLEAAKSGEIGRVYVGERDRISRDPEDCGRVLRSLRDSGVDLVIVSE